MTPEIGIIVDNQLYQYTKVFKKNVTEKQRKRINGKTEIRYLSRKTPQQIQRACGVLPRFYVLNN